MGSTTAPEGGLCALLIVDAHDDARETLGDVAQLHGLVPRMFTTADKAREYLRTSSERLAGAFACVHGHGGAEVAELYEEIRERYPSSVLCAMISSERGARHALARMPSDVQRALKGEDIPLYVYVAARIAGACPPREYGAAHAVQYL